MVPVSEPGPAAFPDAAGPSAFPELEREVSRRRTFAIISHPDAGKTTLTEKLLLYAGAIELAGAVRGRQARRHATSDWMELEQQRGISITSAALEFELQGRRMSLLDTPGHNDFSEDTYRALIAADSVVMVIDAANGVEDQTRKLFEVCRRHRLPILTFVNKFDRPARDPLELRGRYRAHARDRRRAGELADRQRRTVSRRVRHPAPDAASIRTRGAGAVSGAGRPLVARRSGRARDDRRGAVTRISASRWTSSARPATPFDVADYRAGRQTPVFFGSALTNFGLEPFLQALVELAPPPQPRPSDSGIVAPDRRTLHRFRVQDPGEHGSAPSRSRRVRPRLLRPLHEGHGGVQQPAGEVAQGVARVPVLRPRPRDDQRGLRGRHHRPRQPGAVRDRRHAPLRRARAVSRSAALSGGALRARPPAGHPLQAVRRGPAGSSRKKG